MFARTLPVSLPALGLALFAFAPTAKAHIELIEPLARHEIVEFDTGIKSCPCGLGGSNRTCDVAADGSDPNRSERVARYEAGSTITLRFEEYVGHSGSYRVAFDPEGADFDDFNSNILVPIVADPPGDMGNVGEGAIWEIDVTLPDMTCDNCTLQLIQAMHGDQVNPVTDPANLDSYYTCVDLELVPPGTLGDGNEEPGPDDDGSMTDDDGTQGMGMLPGEDDDTGAGPTEMMVPEGSELMPSAPVGMGDLQNEETPAEGMDLMGSANTSGASGGGCSLAASSRGSAVALLGLAGLVAAMAGRRRGRR